MPYNKIQNESFSEYCHRISSVVKEEENLTWNEVRDIINEELNLDFSESYYRKKERDYIPPVEEDLEAFDRSLEAAKIKAKLSDERLQINALIRRISREETLKEIAENAVKEISRRKQLVYNPERIIIEDTFSDGLLLLSDWHYGINIKNAFNEYSPEIAKKRVQKLLNKTIKKCKELNISVLHIANLGDMIAGNIHLPLRLNSRIDVITQTMEVSELLCEFINALSNICHVEYYSVIDNHSRIDPSKQDSLDLESLCRITDWYVKSRLPQVTFNESAFGHDISATSIRNFDIAFIHGHKDKQINMIKELNNFTQKHFDLICSAHYHHFSADESCQTFMLANGSLMGTDDYAYDLRLHSLPSQTFIQISNENVVEGIYKFNLN